MAFDEDLRIDSAGFDKRAAALLKSAANDLKRNSQAAAEDLGLSEEEYRAQTSGEQAFSWPLAQEAATIWPLNERDLIPLRNDCPTGANVYRVEDSKKSARVFQRGGSDYYEYRDTAMSRLASFRPEWIRMLSVVEDSDPSNPKVHWNSGHLLYQFTYFVGPVNYYYRWGGKDYVKEMNTGDSIWGLPFSPHTFTARNADEPAYILALTYGGELMGDAQQELSAVGADTAQAFAVSASDYQGAQAGLLRSHLDAACMPVDVLADEAGLPVPRLQSVAEGKASASDEELHKIAAALRIPVRELHPVVPGTEGGVNFRSVADSRSWTVPAGADNVDYQVRELASDQLHPHTTALEITPLQESGASSLRTHQHQYLYNVGDSPVTFTWQFAGQTHRTVLAAGDSAYVMPHVELSFEADGPAVGDRGHKVLSLRIGGRVGPEARAALGAMYPGSLERYLHEDRQWYDPKGTRRNE